MLIRRLLLIVLLGALAGLLSGCGAGGSGPGAQASATGRSVATPAYTAIIDVRTPAEFAEGHVEGARNIDVSGAGFDGEIADLPAGGTYLVYCRTGNRSAAAAERMRAAGLTVDDGGGLEDMRRAGYPFTD